MFGTQNASHCSFLFGEIPPSSTLSTSPQLWRWKDYSFSFLHIISTSTSTNRLARCREPQCTSHVTHLKIQGHRTLCLPVLKVQFSIHFNMAFMPRIILLLIASLSLQVQALPHALVKRASRTSPPSGCLTVRNSGTKSGEYATLGSALSALGTSSTATACIFIYSGTYNEQVTVNYKGPLTIYGYTTEYVPLRSEITFQPRVLG